MLIPQHLTKLRTQQLFLLVLYLPSLYPGSLLRSHLIPNTTLSKETLLGEYQEELMYGNSISWKLNLNQEHEYCLTETQNCPAWDHIYPNLCDSCPSKTSEFTCSPHCWLSSKDKKHCFLGINYSVLALVLPHVPHKGLPFLSVLPFPEPSLLLTVWFRY